jgi:hypothetical protein
MGDTRTNIDPQGGHGLEHLLGINGSKSNPERVNLDTINPVVDMNMNGYGKLNDLPRLRSKVIGKSLPAPAANLLAWVVSYINPQNALGDDMVYPASHNTRIVAINYHIIVPDPLGLLAGRTYRVDLILYFPDTGINVTFYHGTHQIYSVDGAHAAGRTQSRQYAYPGDILTSEEVAAGTTRYALGSSGYIPCPVLQSGMAIKFAMYPNCLASPDASYFDLPVNTAVYLFVGAQHVPCGAPLPAYW